MPRVYLLDQRWASTKRVPPSLDWSMASFGADLSASGRLFDRPSWAMDTEPFLEAWSIHNRINLYVLGAIAEEALALKAERSKTPIGHFTHIHNVRLMWLKSAAPELLAGLEKLEPDAERAAVVEALAASGEAVTKLMKTGLETSRVKGFKPSAAAFFAYLISHEAFHRAQAELVLRQVGFPLDEKVAYGAWEWGVR